jgi:C4-dicarboxylate-specific signal transduction histidine kinase
MVDGTPFPLALLSDSGSILQVNDAFRGLVGLDDESMASTGSIQDTPLILKRGSWSDALDTANSRVPWRARVEVVREGETRFCEGVVTPLADPNERHLLLALHDRTDEVRAQRELVTREKLATVGEIAAGVAHEVNNPLATIRMEAELLGMAGADPETSQAVATIIKEVDRAASIAQGLLRLSRQSRDAWQGVSLNDLIADIVQIRSRVLRGHGIHLSARLEADVPEVLGNAGDLQQVFVNLITNAEHAVVSSERPTIVLDASLREGVVRVRVSDSGPGVDPAVRTRIFDPFFTTKDPDKGTGLGLALSQRIVSESGGSIWVETSELGGACFVVQLPVAGR